MYRRVLKKLDHGSRGLGSMADTEYLPYGYRTQLQSRLAVLRVDDESVMNQKNEVVATVTGDIAYEQTTGFTG